MNAATPTSRVIPTRSSPKTIDSTSIAPGPADTPALFLRSQSVKEVIPADQLLVYQVKEGWGPLCDFLQVSPPDEAFPHTNKHEEFWDLVGGAR